MWKMYLLCLQFFSNLTCILCVLTQQTRSLLSVFEEDSGMLTNYTNQLLQALQRVFGAQVGNHKQTRGSNVHIQVVFQEENFYVVPYIHLFNYSQSVSANVGQISRICKPWSPLICVEHV